MIENKPDFIVIDIPESTEIPSAPISKPLHVFQASIASAIAPIIEGSTLNTEHHVIEIRGNPDTSNLSNKITMGLRTSDCVLEITTALSKLMQLSNLEYSSDRVQKTIGLVQGVSNLYNGKYTFNLKACFSAIKKDAFLFAKSYATANSLSDLILKTISCSATYINSYAQNESVTNLVKVIDYTVLPVNAVIGESLKLLKKYCGLQCALEMPESTPKEKRLKQLFLIKCRSDLVKAIIKVSLKLASVQNPIINTTLTLGTLVIGMLDAYLTFQEIRA